jgi:hypothetical protein
MLVTQPVMILGETSPPWHHRYPWLGVAVAIGGPLVLGLGVLAILTKVKLAEE